MTKVIKVERILSRNMESSKRLVFWLLLGLGMRCGADGGEAASSSAAVNSAFNIRPLSIFTGNCNASVPRGATVWKRTPAVVDVFFPKVVSGRRQRQIGRWGPFLLDLYRSVFLATFNSSAQFKSIGLLLFLLLCYLLLHCYYIATYYFSAICYYIAPCYYIATCY